MDASGHHDAQCLRRRQRGTPVRCQGVCSVEAATAADEPGAGFWRRVFEDFEGFLVGFVMFLLVCGVFVGGFLVRFGE